MIRNYVIPYFYLQVPKFKDMYHISTPLFTILLIVYVIVEWMRKQFWKLINLFRRI